MPFKVSLKGIFFLKTRFVIKKIQQKKSPSKVLVEALLGSLKKICDKICLKKIVFSLDIGTYKFCGGFIPYRQNEMKR